MRKCIPIQTPPPAPSMQFISRRMSLPPLHPTNPGQLDTLNSRKYQLLQRLGTFDHTRNIGVLHQWLDQHRADGTFRGPVFGPVALEMSVEAGAVGLMPSVAGQYVENVCWHWLGSYVVTNRWWGGEPGRWKGRGEGWDLKT